MKIATRVREFASTVEAGLPGVRVNHDEPLRSGGIWFLDVHYLGRRVVVQWHSRKGFALTRALEDIFGEGPHEVYQDLAAAARRTIQLLRDNAFTYCPTEAPIGLIRLLRGMSQEQLAKRLHVGQPAVSKLERKNNVQIGTLHRVIRALGARLIIRVEWAGRSLELSQFDPPSHHAKGTLPKLPAGTPASARNRGAGRASARRK